MFSTTRRGCQALRAGKRISNMSRTSSHLVRKISTTHLMTQEALATRPMFDTGSLSSVFATPAYTDPESSARTDEEFWRLIPQWRDVSKEDFMSWSWSIKNVVETNKNTNKLVDFFYAVIPDEVPRRLGVPGLQSRDEFIGDVLNGIRKSAMSVRVMPYVLSRINWADPANDPIFNQFIPLASVMVKDHPEVKLDPLNERGDRPVSGVIHRYPDKALFLPISVCPTYCMFCTRSYGIGPQTEEVSKEPFKPKPEKIQKAFEYIESQEGLHDVVISGGDAFYLQPDLLEAIGDRLIRMKNIHRFRIASKGLAVSPHRFLDKADPWVDALIRVADKARRAGKHMALHTHFNHPNEVSWITEQASLKLLQSGITVRNQAVLLRGINDNADTIVALIKKLAKMAIEPYYVYQCDMGPKIEHLRTPLATIIDIEAQIQGIVAGFLVPKFVVDLPGGGGKRPVSLYESYDRKTGVSTFTQPVLKGKGRDNKVYKYYDPAPTGAPMASEARSQAI